MRALTALILASVIVLCPALCGAVDAALGPHEHGPSPCSPVPADCPESQDDCICHGAVVQSSVSPTQASGVFQPGWGAPAFALAPPPPLPHSSRADSPSSLAALGDSRFARALLQNFRC